MNTKQKKHPPTWRKILVGDALFRFRSQIVSFFQFEKLLNVVLVNPFFHKKKNQPSLKNQTQKTTLSRNWSVFKNQGFSFNAQLEEKIKWRKYKRKKWPSKKSVQVCQFLLLWHSLSSYPQFHQSLIPGEEVLLVMLKLVVQSKYNFH